MLYFKGGIVKASFHGSFKKWKFRIIHVKILYYNRSIDFTNPLTDVLKSYVTSGNSRNLKIWITISSGNKPNDRKFELPNI